MSGIAQENCVTLNNDTQPLDDKEMKQMRLMEVPMWELVKEDGSKRLHRVFTLPSAADTLGLVNKIIMCAEIEAHHPVMTVDQKTLTIECWSQDLKGLHRNDFIIAAKIDEIYLAWMDELRKKDAVQEASEESFPASDAPGWVGKKGEEELEKSST